MPFGRAAGAPDQFSLRRWIIWVTVGESLGFAFPATVGALSATQGWADRVTYLALVAAGLIEGALLGGFQAQLLTRWNILSRRRDWVASVLVAPGGCVLLLSLPVSQYLVLRRHLQRAWRWVRITVLAWSIGLLWTLAPSPFIDEQTPLTVLVVVYAVVGSGMAATVALISGQGLRQLLAIQPDSAEWLDDRERVPRE